MTYTELANRYVELTRSTPDRRWKESTLAKKIAEIEQGIADEQARKAEKAAQAEVARIGRETRIVARGTMEEFAATVYRTENEEDRRLAQTVRWALTSMENHAEMSAKFAADYAKNPQYTMSWSNKYFIHAAEYSVAQVVQAYFEAGATTEEMAAYAMDQVFHGAKYPARSTSPSSNLAEQEQLVVWTRVAGMLNGKDFY